MKKAFSIFLCVALMVCAMAFTVSADYTLHGVTNGEYAAGYDESDLIASAELAFDGTTRTVKGTIITSNPTDVEELWKLRVLVGITYFDTEMDMNVDNIAMIMPANTYYARYSNEFIASTNKSIVRISTECRVTDFDTSAIMWEGSMEKTVSYAGINI